MERKLIISCEDEEAKIMASLDKNVLDHIPTDQKYNKEMEEILYNEYGHGFISLEAEKKFEIPDYISEEDITIWEAEKILYDTTAYPETNNYTLKKH